jgi:hypothetical protein
VRHNPEEPPAEGAQNLRAETRRWATITLALLAGGLLLALILPAKVRYLAIGPAAAALIAGLLAYRCFLARHALRDGGRRVGVVGWIRVPDACNFAVFRLGVDMRHAKPELVIRLPACVPSRRRTPGSQPRGYDRTSSAPQR